MSKVINHCKKSFTFIVFSSSSPHSATCYYHFLLLFTNLLFSCLSLPAWES